MPTINLLSIGNSFSVDAHRYLHYIARGEGVDIHVTNLIIAGCPFERHYTYMKGDNKRYHLQINGGAGTGLYISIDDALTAKPWDYITVQQASPLSPDYDTYQPYASGLCEHIRSFCPKAKLMVHETWGYETGSNAIGKTEFETYDEMFAKIHESYEKLAKDVKADGVIPSGSVFKKAFELGVEKLHRDGLHATVDLGSFILGLTWYKTLTGNSIDDVKFNMFENGISDEEYQLAIKAVNEVVK